jgi:PAS domain S-box-containing protein
MFDREMRYLVHSRQWLADYHLDGQSLIGRSHYDVFSEIGEEWKAIHRRCLAGAIETRAADLFVRRDGSRQWLTWEVRPWHTPAGEIGGIVMFTQDITHRKELEENLAKARDEALETSRLKSDFLATMSHEIRTPMNAIVGMAGLLADTPLNSEQREMLRAVSGGAEGLLVIINDALDLSRIEAGQLRLDPADFDLGRVIEETVALLAPAAHEKRLELTCEIDPAPDRLLLGDAGRVRQILINLIGNAVKFTAAGEVSVLARAGAGAGNRTRVRIEIKDTGIGIPEAARTRLFEPFAQVDGSSTRRFGGTGLGLAITRQLVAAMGGEIGFQSEIGRGSVFWVELELDGRGPRPTTVANVPPGHRVLVVEDHATQRAVLLRQLARCGVEGEAVGDGAAALARLRQPGGRPWSLILVDWEMAPVNGVELAAEIRADAAGAALPLVLFAPAAGGADVISALGPEFAAVLTKPVTDEKLARCLARVLGGAAGEPVEALPAPPVNRPARGLRLLLAEDNAANQRVASLLLERMGHTVELAANGAVALERLGAEPFDAVLMDCQMPVLDGYEATRRIRSGALPGVNPRVPVIALTAYARPEDRAHCLAAGMDGYVPKPIRPAELQAALNSCRAGREAPPTAVSAAGPAVLDRHAVEVARGLPGRDDGTLLAEMVGLYLQDESVRLERLRHLEDQRRGPELAEEAHAFGSNAAALGAVGVRHVALQLEAAARAADWPAAATRSALAGACAQLRDALKQLNVTGP